MRGRHPGILEQRRFFAHAGSRRPRGPTNDSHRGAPASPRKWRTHYGNPSSARASTQAGGSPSGPEAVETPFNVIPARRWRRPTRPPFPGTARFEAPRSAIPRDRASRTLQPRMNGRKIDGRFSKKKRACNMPRHVEADCPARPRRSRLNDLGGAGRPAHGLLRASRRGCALPGERSDAWIPSSQPLPPTDCTGRTKRTSFSDAAKWPSIHRRETAIGTPTAPRRNSLGCRPVESLRRGPSSGNAMPAPLRPPLGSLMPEARAPCHP